VGAASSRDHAIMAIERLFFAAGSRSHEKLLQSKANDIDPRFHEAFKDIGYKIKPLAAEKAQAA
jgi:hypothetical protein